MRTEYQLSSKSTSLLEKTRRLYRWVGTVSFLTAFTWCFLAGIWLDWRWLLTMLLPLFSWCIAQHVLDQLDTELQRRKEEEPECSG